MRWEEKKEYLQDYMVMLYQVYHGGYTERFRADVVKQAIARYDGMVSADRDGQHPMYMERTWQKEERRKRKKEKKTNWLTKGGHETVIVVAPTSGGEIIDENPGPIRIKIQEAGGIQVKNKLQKN